MYLLRSAQTALRDASHSPTPQVFIECDCTMLEINPLASLTDGRVLVCDSKVGRVFRKKTGSWQITGGSGRRKSLMLRS